MSKPIKIKNGKGCIYNGQAGSGKTTRLCQMVIEAENPIVLTFTNKAIENVKNRLIQMGYDNKKTNKICYTFDSFFVIGMGDLLVVSMGKPFLLKNSVWYQTNG